MIRSCIEADIPEMLSVINNAAQVYKGAIPSDRWQDPYMPREELLDQISEGLRFWGWVDEAGMAGVMGLQPREGVTLIRHAYVLTSRQGQGIGSGLLKHLQAMADQPLLVGTWVAAGWAIRFYTRHGFQLVGEAEKERLLRLYWSIPQRQVETSVVLADNAWVLRRGSGSRA